MSARLPGTVIALLALALPTAVGAPGQPESVPDAHLRSPLALVASADGAHAWTVNYTRGTVSELDVHHGTVLRELPIGDHPAGAALSPDGRTLYVSLRWEHRVAALDVASGTVRAHLPTGLEPYDLAVSPDGASLYVVNSVSETLSIIDLASTTERARISLGQDPRYVAVSADGRRVVVTNGLERGLSIIDPVRGVELERRDLGRASIVRDVALSPDGRTAYVAHVVSHDEVPTLQMERGWIHSNGLSMLNLDEPGHRVTVLLDDVLRGASNPWGVALDPAGDRLFVSLAGVHEVATIELELLRDAARGVDTAAEVRALEEDVDLRERTGFATRDSTGGEGPRALAWLPGANALLVGHYFSDDVTVWDPTRRAARSRIALSEGGPVSERRKGEALFNDARLCYQTWFSCASCHQEDATADALNWDLPNDGLGNAKNVKSLRDAVDTPPAMWGGVRADMDAAVQAGQRFLGFLPQPENHAALKAYLATARDTPNPWLTVTPPEQIARGEAAYAKARCDTCHPAPLYTDLQKHDVGLRVADDQRDRLDTPSIREIYRTAPYLHDGSAPSLRSIFTVRDPEGRHGRVEDLSLAELEDLLAYLRTR